MKLRYFTKFFKILGILVLFLILLVITAAILLQRPSVQTWAGNKLLDRVEKRTGTEASLDRIRIDLPRSLVLEGFYMEDEHGDTLLYAGKLDANFNFFNPFKRKIHVGTITLDQARVFLKRENEGIAYNIANVLFGEPGAPPATDSLQTSDSMEPTTVKRPYDLAIEKFVLNDAYLEVIDEGYISMTPITLKRLSLDVRHVDLKGKSVEIDELILDQPQLNLNVQASREKPEVKPLQRLIPDIGWNVVLHDFKLNDGAFTGNIQTLANNSIMPLDWSNMNFSDINVHLKDIGLDSMLQADIQLMRAGDGHHVNLRDVNGQVVLSENSVEVENLKIDFNSSSLQLDSKVEISDFSDLLNRTAQSSHIIARVDPIDANLFLPGEQHIRQKIFTDIKVSGSLNNLVFSRFTASVNGNRLSATGRVKNMEEPGNMNFDLSIASISASAKKVEGIASWIKVPQEVHNLGDAAVSGTLKGSLSDVHAVLDVNTDLGDMLTDIRVQNGDGPLTYNGELEFPGLNVKNLLPDAGFGVISGVIDINGSGTALDELDAELTGLLAQMEFNGYRYQNIGLTGQVDDQVFDGNIQVDDDCLVMDFTGQINFGDSIPAIDCSLKVDNADLQNLNLFKDKLIVSLDGNFQLTGSNINNLNGDLHMDQLELVNNNGEVQFDTTLLVIRSEGDFKQYDLINNHLAATIRGAFDPLVLSDEVRRYLSDYIYYVNYGDTIPMRPQQIQGTISIAEGFGLTQFFLGNVELPDNLEASFDFDNRKNKFEIDMHSNFVGYNRWGVDTLLLSMKTKGPALLVNASVDGLNLKKSKFKINQVDLVTASTKDYITWNLEVEEDNASNRLSLSPQVEFIGDSIFVHFLDSYIRLNDVNWPFNENNQLIIHEDAFIAEDFSIHNQGQYLEIINASSDLSDVSLEFSGLDLPAFASIVQLDTIIQGGMLSGIVRVTDPLQDMNADIGLIFDSLQVFEYYCNQLSIDAYYDKLTNMVELAADFNDPNYDLTAIGSYDLNPGVNNAADLDIDVRALSLSFLDKILKYEADIDALARGQMQFRGSATKPILLGDAVMIDTAVVHIKFLGADLIMVEEEVNFTENTIDFKSVNVFDPFGNQGFLEGKLTHYHFKDVSVSATLASDNFNLLNTTYDDNDQFYGQAFGDGIIQFSGLTRNINIDIDMKTNPGTKLSIPLAKAGDTKQYENIIFINPYDTIVESKIEEPIEIKGVNLDFNLEVTPDAELELVLNTDSENNMIAHGSGNLDLQIDQNKQLSIYGRYDIRDGKYVFSPQNLLNKRFDILNGSHINWTGNPFEGELAVEAAYNVKARVDNILEDSTQASQTVPMDVIIEIGGTLDDTEVAFDIRAQQSGLTNVPDEVTIFLEDIKDDEGEVTTQAIALLLVGRFLPSNTTVFSNSSFSAGEFGKTTAFELISNQISNYLTDAISKLITEAELNFAFTQRESYTSEEPGQTTEFQVDFQTSFVNNRIIVKVGGNFEVNDAESARENTIAGDFEIQGLLTKDGRLRGKAYHRTADYDIFNQDRSKTGVGISYQKDFDKIGEVFQPDEQKKARRKIKRQDRRDRKEDKKLNKEREDALTREE